MFAAVSQYEDVHAPLNASACKRADLPELERAEGAVRLGFAGYAGRSRLFRNYQRGSLKVRFPRVHAAEIPEAILLNTAGGITGGDRFSVGVELGEDAMLSISSQAAERIYRSVSGEGAIEVSIRLAAGCRLHWLPQETILFDGGRMTRSVDIEMDGDSELVMCESVILGRTAHGEIVRRGRLSDRWRVRRAGKLIYADNLLLDGEWTVSEPGVAVLGGGRTFASVLIVRPDAESAIDLVREALSAGPATGGASAWDGMLSARLVADDGAGLRRSVIRLCAAVGVTMPRAWSV